MTPFPDSDQLRAATRSLAFLQAQAEALQAEMARMRRKLAQCESDLERSQIAAPLQADARQPRSSDAFERRGKALSPEDLIEANGQLLLAALDAKAAQETAVSELGELTRSSHRDALTDLPNRVLMLDRLQGAMASARRRGTRLALLFIDVDHFKQINDSLGHSAGDQVLREVAQRLRSGVRVSDTVSRHGGDEFLVLLTDVNRTDDALLAATKMLAAFAPPCEAGAETLSLTVSVGIAMYPGDGDVAGDSPATLIARADAAMYRAKQAGPGRCSL